MIPPDEKAERARQKLLEKAKEYQIGTYGRRFVAPLFQKLVRAEAGADTRKFVPAIVRGLVQQVARRSGECVCITCGAIHGWDSGLGGIHAGHFLGSRCNSIIYDEANVAPQCSKCNVYRNGAPQEFRIWMEAVRGAAEIERLERLKPTSRQFSREELVDMRIAFQKRLNAAIQKMNSP